MQKLDTSAYEQRLANEINVYKNVENVNALPQIFHYWSDKYVRPMIEEFGASNPHEFFAKYLRESAARCGSDKPLFISIGAGNCDSEVRIAKILLKSGFKRFQIECLDINPHMLSRGRKLAEQEGVADNIITAENDFNNWRAGRQYAGVMANQSLHHVLNLEGLFDEIKRCLHPGAYFVANDMIGRNGHQRWPEALEQVHRFWTELPNDYRFNQLLKRYEQLYENWDCSQQEFEGIRAQDILPLLLERFDLPVFIGFANIIDVFVDRPFGHNFNIQQPWDRDFIDRLHAVDEEGLRSGKLTPTHMLVVMTPSPSLTHRYSRGLNPRSCVRLQKADERPSLGH